MNIYKGCLRFHLKKKGDARVNHKLNYCIIYEYLYIIYKCLCNYDFCKQTKCVKMSSIKVSFYPTDALRSGGNVQIK